MLNASTDYYVGRYRERCITIFQQLLTQRPSSAAVVEIGQLSGPRIRASRRGSKSDWYADVNVSGLVSTPIPYSPRNLRIEAIY